MNFGSGVATGAAIMGFFWFLMKGRKLEIERVSTSILHDEEAMAMILEGWEALDVLDRELEREAEEFGPPEPDWDDIEGED